MTTLFPNIETDIAAALDAQPYDLEAAIKGKELEARIEAVNLWADFCALQILTRRTDDQKRTKFAAIHWTLCRAFEAMAWEQVDSIVDAMEKEFG